jgi:hypothetical protein
MTALASTRAHAARGSAKGQELIVVHGSACIDRHRASASCSCVRGWPRHAPPVPVAARATLTRRGVHYIPPRAYVHHLACCVATSDDTGERHVHTGSPRHSHISPISSLMVGCMLRAVRCVKYYTHPCDVAPRDRSLNHQCSRSIGTRP